MPNFQPDLVVKGLKGDLIAIIEVKNILDLSRDEAIEMRHDLLEYGFPNQAPYFLLLSQDVGFLWNESQRGRSDIPPAYEFPMGKVVERYTKRKAGQRLYGSELELLVLQWLLDLAAKPEQEAEEPEKTLALSGFSEDIQGADILLEQAA